MIKCIIVEDETLAQHVIQSHLEKVEHFELVGVYRNAPEAREGLAKQDVDLMFLDIQLPGMTGLNFLRSLTDPPLVVLTTAYPEHAVESYELNVIDYLLKPISFDRFLKTVNKIADGRLVTEPDKNSEPVGDHIFVKANSKFFRVGFSSIVFIEGMKDYLKIHTLENTLITHQTMSDIERILPPKLFFRVHKSYIISLSHVRAIYGNSIELEKATIPIGINYRDKVFSLVGKK